MEVFWTLTNSLYFVSVLLVLKYLSSAKFT